MRMVMSTKVRFRPASANRENEGEMILRRREAMKQGRVSKSDENRRAFLKTGMITAGAFAVGGALTPNVAAFGQEDEKSGRLTKGDAAILRFLAAAEILETDLWQHYNEPGGRPDNEVSGWIEK